MRQVDREIVQTPAPLRANLSEAIQRVAEGSKARSEIYAHVEVRNALRQIYLQKCFVCERSVDLDGEIEHFLPWHPMAASRAYAWENLHLSCRDCNSRKRRAIYKEQPDAALPVVKTLLVDPSAVAAGRALEKIIGFDAVCDAVLLDLSYDPPCAANTVDFLNDSIPTILRLRRLKEMMDVIYHANCKASWEVLAGFDPIPIETWHVEERISFEHALERADAVYHTFLGDRAPFSVAMRAALLESIRISASAFRRMSEAWRSRSSR